MRKAMITIVILVFVLSCSRCNADELSIGSKGASVFDLQTKLIEYGYDIGTIDGSFGKKTQQALLEFQKDHDLEQTGILDDVTKAILYGLYGTDYTESTDILERSFGEYNLHLWCMNYYNNEPMGEVDVPAIVLRTISENNGVITVMFEHYIDDTVISDWNRKYYTKDIWKTRVNLASGAYDCETEMPFVGDNTNVELLSNGRYYTINFKYTEYIPDSFTEGMILSRRTVIELPYDFNISRLHYLVKSMRHDGTWLFYDFAQLPLLPTEDDLDEYHYHEYKQITEISLKWQDRVAAAQSHPNHKKVFKCATCNSIIESEYEYYENCCLCTGQHEFEVYNKTRPNDVDVYVKYDKDCVYRECSFCHKVMSREDDQDRVEKTGEFISIIREEKIQEDLIRNERIRTFLEDELINILGEDRKEKVKRIIQILIDANPMYSDLFLFSFTQYNIVADFNYTKMGNEETVNVSRNNMYYNTVFFKENDLDNRETWLELFFHECAHAIDCNAFEKKETETGYYTKKKDTMDHITKDVELQLTEMLNSYKIIDPDISEEESYALIQNLLHPDDETNRIPNSLVNYKEEFVAYCNRIIKSLNIMDNHYMGEDIIGSITNEIITGSDVGHRSEWWYETDPETGKLRSTDNQAIEAWAEFFSAMITGNSRAQAANIMFFDETYEYFEKTVAPSLLEYYKSIILCN